MGGVFSISCFHLVVDLVLGEAAGPRQLFLRLDGFGDGRGTRSTWVSAVDAARWYRVSCSPS